MTLLAQIALKHSAAASTLPKPARPAWPSSAQAPCWACWTTPRWTLPAWPGSSSSPGSSCSGRTASSRWLCRGPRRRTTAARRELPRRQRRGRRLRRRRRRPREGRGRGRRRLRGVGGARGLAGLLAAALVGRAREVPDPVRRLSYLGHRRRRLLRRSSASSASTPPLCSRSEASGGSRSASARRR